MGFGERLFNIRNKENMTREELAQKLSCSPKTIAAYENGQNTPSYDTFINICNIFKRDANYFMQDGLNYMEFELNPEDEKLISGYQSLTYHDKEIVDYILNMEDTSETPEFVPIYRFPVFKQEAGAGIGILNNSDNYDMEEYQVNNIPSNAVFAMKIKGDSMYNEKNGHIKNKAKVLINPKDTDYENKIVIANLDGECVCKRYTTVENHVEFKSDNGLRQDENKDSRNYIEPKVIGVVLGIIEDKRFIPVK